MKKKPLRFTKPPTNRYLFHVKDPFPPYLLKSWHPPQQHNFNELPFSLSTELQKQLLMKENQFFNLCSIALKRRLIIFPEIKNKRINLHYIKWHSNLIVWLQCGRLLFAIGYCIIMRNSFVIWWEFAQQRFWEILMDVCLKFWWNLRNFQKARAVDSIHCNFFSILKLWALKSHI